jgi:hypothetical protein
MVPLYRYLQDPIIDLDGRTGFVGQNHICKTEEFKLFGDLQVSYYVE